MVAPLAPAAVPAEAWTHLRRLPEIEAHREALRQSGPFSGRSERCVYRRVQLRELTLEALRRSARLKALGVAPERIADAAPIRSTQED